MRVGTHAIETKPPRQERRPRSTVRKAVEHQSVRRQSEVMPLQRSRGLILILLTKCETITGHVSNAAPMKSWSRQISRHRRIVRKLSNEMSNSEGTMLSPFRPTLAEENNMHNLIENRRVLRMQFEAFAHYARHESEGPNRHLVSMH